MPNKIFTAILVALILICSGLGYFSYTLYLRLDSIEGRLATFQEEQKDMLAAVSAGIEELRSETSEQVRELTGELQDQSQAMQAFFASTEEDVAALESGIANNRAKTNAIAQEIDETIARISSFGDNLTEITDEIFRSIMNASETYKLVSNSTVRISNGERVIGSGFLHDDRAHVVTANHVIEGLSTIYAVLPDGTVSTATVIGSSVPSDIAVLRLNQPADSPPLTLADSSAVEIGEPVAAIGSPFEMGETLTTGIVSQKDRYINITGGTTSRWVANLLQFDAAVNFGNSGCPLVNSAGEVVGMVIARVDPVEGDGMYYAVSSNKMDRVIQSLISSGYYAYPRLGLNISDLTPRIAQQEGLSTTNGVVVDSVGAGGPAGTAGIRAQDIITGIDDVAVADIGGFTSYLGENVSPGDRVIISLIRNDSSLDLPVQVGAR